MMDILPVSSSTEQQVEIGINVENPRQHRCEVEDKSLLYEKKRNIHDNTPEKSLQ